MEQTAGSGWAGAEKTSLGNGAAGTGGARRSGVFFLGGGYAPACAGILKRLRRPGFEAPRKKGRRKILGACTMQPGPEIQRPAHTEAGARSGAFIQAGMGGG